jgi:hypothetical protein
MRSVLAILVFVVAALPFQLQAQSSQKPAAQPASQPAQPAPSPRFWYAIENATGGFSVDMPGKPAERQLNFRDQAGKSIAVFLQEVLLDNGATYFGMIWRQLDAVPKDASGIEKELLSTRDATMQSLKGTLITTRSIKLGALNGIDYVVQAGPQATRYRYRAFIVGNRLVQQAYSGATGSENSPEARKFLDSLKLAAHAS